MKCTAMGLPALRKKVEAHPMPMRPFHTYHKASAFPNNLIALTCFTFRHCVFRFRLEVLG